MLRAHGYVIGLCVGLWLYSSGPCFSQTAPISESKPAVDQNAGAEVRPRIPANFPRPLKVGVILVLNNITKLDEAAGNYEATIDLHLRWRDPSLAFDPKVFGTNRQALGFEQAAVKLATIWNPQIVMANIKDKPIFLEPTLMINEDGTVIYIQRIKAVFESKFRLTAFPFDTQTLKVQLLCNRFNNEEVQFIQNQHDINHSGLREGVTLAGWDLKGVQFMARDIRGRDGNYLPLFEAKVIMRREPLGHLFIFAPLLLIIIVPTLLTLYVEGTVGTRLGTWSGAMLALIAMSFTLDLRYPQLEPDSILAQMVTILFGYQFLMMCLCMTILNPPIAEKVRNPYLIPEIINFLRWSVPVGLIILIVVRILLTALSLENIVT